MLSYLPKSIANKGLTIYVICLFAVSVVFYRYSISLIWILFGLVEVWLFFSMSNKLTKEWQHFSQRQFVGKLFKTAFGIRVAWVIFSYFFYTIMTGGPFEFECRDSIGYHQMGLWLKNEPWNMVFYYLFTGPGAVVSDGGYSFYLTCLYKLIGPNIFLTRVLKSLYSAYTCVFLYRLASRTIGEQPGRMAGIFAMLMPNLIVYCGMHVKETEMLFLVVAFLERADYAYRSKKFDVVKILVPILLGGALFTFRTVLGVVAFFSFLTVLFFGPNKIIDKGQRFLLFFWVILALGVLGGGAIMNEVEELWANKESNVEGKRMEQTSRGNQWAKYATGSVMAPMVVVLPFSTMVDTGQFNQLVVGGGNYVRNFMGFFALAAIFSAIFVQKNWRELALVGSYTFGYLGIISLSGFSSSERFLLPGLVGLVIMWAYGVSLLNAKYLRFVRYWYVVVVLMEVGWAYFKIGSRGLL